MSALQNADKVRILVLGDSGVGKTSLIELVCSGEELRKPRSTVGCAVHMKIHESRATVCAGRPERVRAPRRAPSGPSFPRVPLLTLRPAHACPVVCAGQDLLRRVLGYRRFRALQGKQTRKYPQRACTGVRTPAGLDDRRPAREQLSARLLAHLPRVLTRACAPPALPAFLRPLQVFYGTAFDGVLLVYDLANSVSRRNLEKWRTEWQSAHFGGGAGAWGGGHHSSSAGAGAGVWAEDSQDLGYFSPAKRRSIDAQNAWGAGAGGAGGAPRGSGALPPILTGKTPRRSERARALAPVHVHMRAGSPARAHAFAPQDSACFCVLVAERVGGWGGGGREGGRTGGREGGRKSACGHRESEKEKE